MRSDETRELLADPLAFALLALIAYRAQRTTTFNRHGLEPGQAFIGDYKTCGLSEQQYRTAKAKLSEWKFATFKATNKGTIATLINTRVFDINAEPINGQNNSPSTDGQRTGNGQSTTTNNVKNEKSKKRGSRPTISHAQQRIEWEGELKRVGKELETLYSLNDHDKGSKRYNRHVDLTARQIELRKILGVIA